MNKHRARHRADTRNFKSVLAAAATGLITIIITAFLTGMLEQAGEHFITWIQRWGER